MFYFGQPPLLFLNQIIHTAPTAIGFEVNKLIWTGSAKFVPNQNDIQAIHWEYVNQRNNQVWGLAAFSSQAMEIFLCQNTFLIFQSTVVTVFLLNLPTGKFFSSCSFSALTRASFAI